MIGDRQAFFVTAVAKCFGHSKKSWLLSASELLRQHKEVLYHVYVLPLPFTFMQVANTMSGYEYVEITKIYIQTVLM